MDYQVEGIAWMSRREKSPFHPGGFLCDEMGLGKTIQMIGTMMKNRVSRTLIIVPVSIVSQWVRQIEKWSDLSVAVFNGNPLTDIVVTSYSSFLHSSSLYGSLFAYDWDRVVLDEAHEVNSPKSKKFQSLLKLSARIRWIITGTLIVNSERDYLTLLRFFTRDSFFQETKRDVVLKRTKKSVKIDLPPMVFENIRIEPYPEEKKEYDDMVQNIGETDEIKRVLKGVMIIRQLCIHPVLRNPEYKGRSKRLEVLSEMVRSHPSEKTLIFCQFKKEMDLICEMFKDRDVFRLDGCTSMSSRSLLIDRFTASKPGSVFVIQIKSGGAGINLQCASRVYITSPSWNPATELQAIGRAHRIGQKKTVHVYKLFYSGIEECIIQLQEQKSHITARVMEDPEMIDMLPMPDDLAKSLRMLSRFFCK